MRVVRCKSDMCGRFVDAIVGQGRQSQLIDGGFEQTAVGRIHFAVFF